MNCKILISLDLSVDKSRGAKPCILYIKVVNCCIFVVVFLHSIILHAVWLKIKKHVDLWSTNVESVGIIELILIQYNLYVMCQFQQNGCIYKSVDKHKNILWVSWNFSAKNILWISKLLYMFLAEWKWIKYRSLMHFLFLSNLFLFFSYFQKFDTCRENNQIFEILLISKSS